VPYPLAVLGIALVFGVVVWAVERGGSSTPSPGGGEPAPTDARACAAPRMRFTAERPISATERATVRIPVTEVVEGESARVTARGASQSTAQVTADAVVRATASAARRSCATAGTPEEAEQRAAAAAERRGRAAARRAALRSVRRRTPAALERLRDRARTRARAQAEEQARSGVPDVREDLRRRAAEQAG
jgi:hypothetical protein